MKLRSAAVGVAIGERANDAREIGGNNLGEYDRKYLKATGIMVSAPWCAAFVYWCASEAAEVLGVANPLELVKRRALVADYIDLARKEGWLVGPIEAREGDLVAFKWSSGNHIGFLLDRPAIGTADAPLVVHPFWTIEGNTDPGVGLTDMERDREGDGVYVRSRAYDPKRVFFIRWDNDLIGPLA